MELRRISFEQLYAEFPQSLTPYGSMAFNRLNASKADALYAFALYDSKGKARLGLLAGLRGDQWCVPFSAPFGEILYRKPQTFETCMEFARAVTEAIPDELQLTLAPDLYDPLMLPRFKGAFAAVASGIYQDYNYSYPLQRYCDFVSGLGANARNHYNRSARAGFEFKADADPARVYEVIRRNRLWRGYPLAMSFEALQATAAIIDIHWHLLSLDGADVASAVVYRLTPGVAQVIYWGDVEGYSSERPMNMLACRVTDHYRRLGLEVLDIGPSSSRGVPDVGLCTFKESLGCDLSFKPTYIIQSKLHAE